MKHPIRFAFFLAIPLEAANLYFRGSSIGSGISIGAITVDQLLRYQFDFLHTPGYYASEWFYYHRIPKVGTLAIAACGYFETVLGLIVLIFLGKALFSREKRRPPTHDEPAED